MPFAVCALPLYKSAVQAISYIVTAVAAYLLGSIPTGYLVAKSRGIDIRKVGSGNIGATNVFRILGKPAGIFVLVVDAMKGFFACQFVGVFAYIWLVQGTGFAAESADAEFHKIVAGVFAILGHNYTCWLKFKGGKGVATSAGVILALLPMALGIAFIVWVLLFAVTRYVSVASMGAAFVLPFATYWTEYSLRMVGVAAAIGALAIYKHRTNIQRLRAGTESRFGKKREASP